MSLIILVFIIMSLLVLAMSIGVIMGRKPISGSCGGLSSLGMKSACDICGGVDKCEKEIQAPNNEEDKALGYDVARQDNRGRS